MKLTGQGLMKGPDRAGGSDTHDRGNFDVCIFKVGRVVLLGKGELLAQRAMGPVVLGRFADMSQVHVHRKPGGHRQEADDPEGQEHVAYTLAHAVHL